MSDTSPEFDRSIRQSVARYVTTRLMVDHQLSPYEKELLVESMVTFVKFGLARFGSARPRDPSDSQTEVVVRAIVDQFAAAVDGIVTGASVAKEFGQ